jgi:hypothetical protein
MYVLRLYAWLLCVCVFELCSKRKRMKYGRKEEEETRRKASRPPPASSLSSAPQSRARAGSNTRQLHGRSYLTRLLTQWASPGDRYGPWERGRAGGSEIIEQRGGRLVGVRVAFACGGGGGGRDQRPAADDDAERAEDGLSLSPLCRSVGTDEGLEKGGCHNRGIFPWGWSKEQSTLGKSKRNGSRLPPPPPPRGESALARRRVRLARRQKGKKNKARRND